MKRLVFPLMVVMLVTGLTLSVCSQATAGAAKIDFPTSFEPGSQTIQVRSASRLGYRDFGVNRARIEDIRRWLAASGA